MTIPDIDPAPLRRLNLAELLRDCVRSFSLGYIYVPLGKCANTDIKRMLWAAHNGIGYAEPVPDDYFDVHNFGKLKSSGEVPSPWDHYRPTDFGQLIYDMTARRHLYRFSVVRNPYSRLLSGYLDKVQGDRSRRDGRLESLRLPEAPQSFEEFARMVCDQPNEKRNIHWADQVYKLGADFFEYDYIGHFEQLDAAKAHVIATLHLTVPDSAPPAIHRTGASELVRDSYSDEIASLVHRTFRRDFEMFGYSDDPAVLAPVRPQLATGQQVKAVLPYRSIIARRRGLPPRITVLKGGRQAKAMQAAN